MTDNMQASLPEKLISAAAAVLVVALLGYLLLAGLAVQTGKRIDRLVVLVAFRHPIPTPLSVPVQSRRPQVLRDSPSLPKAEGKAARSLFPPTPMPPAVIPLVPTASANEQAGPASGSDLPGTGTGAGGSGNGGGGQGGGGQGGDVPPRLIRGRLKFSDLPQSLRDRGVGGSVSVRYDVGIDGHAEDCIIAISSGSADLDQQTCALIQQRFRFVPSRDADGNPVRSTVEETHSWEIRRDDSPH